MVKPLLDVMKLTQPATRVVVGVIDGINANQDLDIWDCGIMFFGIVVQPLAILDVPILLPSAFIGELILAACAVSIRTVLGERLDVFHRQYCS